MKLKNNFFVIAIVSVFFLTGCTYPAQTPTPTTDNAKISPPTSSAPNAPVDNNIKSATGLTEAEAKIIAEKICIKGGETLSPGYYNENSQTWWFDANLNATKEGCNPACVVSEDTKTAEINWRCTGLIIPKEPAEKCGLENCHGLDIACGPNVAEMCTEIYMAGDNCRQYAGCGIVNGKCQAIKSAKFESCKTCVEKCQTENKKNQIEFFQCESKCANG